MFTNCYKIVFLFKFCSIIYLSIGMILIVKTEATNNDIKYELFHSRSATNLTLSHPLPENVYYMSKKSINSNNVMPSSVKSSHLMANQETGKVKKPSSNLLVRCYGRLGCFSISEPFLSIYRPINLFPLPDDILNVGILLKTRNNPERFEEIILKNDGLYHLLDFNSKNDLKVIIHGYLEHGFQSWIKDMSLELLSNSDVNVISIDWMIGATPPYTQAVANARLVGAIIADVIQSIQKQHPGYSSSKIHLIGHSLGAHIAGYVGERIPGLGRITGLDPAEPYFQNTDPKVRLDSSDANFVDVIHTDASSIISGGFGMSQGCGHIDFYPNGGRKQPGCNEGPVKSVLDSFGKERNVIHGIRRFIGCNHIRAFLLFTESINSECPFMAFHCSNYEEFASGRCTKDKNPCHSNASHTDKNKTMSANDPKDLECLRMGFNADIGWKKQFHPNDSEANKRNSQTGQTSAQTTGSSQMYFMQTSDQTPYCEYHYRIKIWIKSRNDLTTNTIEKGRLFIQIFGTRGSTPILEATKDTIQFGSTETIDFLISSRNIGTVLRLELHLKTSSSLMINPLRWRLNDSNQIYLTQITITTLESGHKIIFCGEDIALKAQELKILFNTGCDPLESSNKRRV